MSKDEDQIFISEEHGSIARADLAALTEDEKLEVMEAWFRERFEDPANETPRWDGDFHFLWGGPYEPSEELYEAFGDVVSHALITSLAKEFWREAGDQWAPTSNYHDVQEDEPDDAYDEPLQLGSDEERGSRAEVLEKLSAVEAVLAQRPALSGMIGHNHPPDPIEGAASDEIEELAASITQVRNELQKALPDFPAVLLQQKIVGRVRESLKVALERRSGLAADEFAKKIGATAATLPFWYGLYTALRDFGDILGLWLHALGLH